MSMNLIFDSTQIQFRSSVEYIFVPSPSKATLKRIMVYLSHNIMTEIIMKKVTFQQKFLSQVGTVKGSDFQIMLLLSV